LGVKVHRYHVEKDAIQGDKHIADATIPYSKLEDDTILAEIHIPIVVYKQSVVSTTLTT